MDLFTPIVDEHRQHPNFKRVRLHSPTQKRIIQEWATGFLDRDGKFVNEFQTTFNSCFWELYIFACLKEFGLVVDFTHQSPDFTITNGFFKGNVECVTSQNARGQRPEHDLTFEERIEHPEGASRDVVAREATIRLANSLSAKSEYYRRHYATLPHVGGKPFILAIAPFEEPYFWIQRLDGITNVLYQSKLSEVTKQNGSVIPLGYFLNDSMTYVSAVFFSNVATYSKIVAMANEPDAINYFVTARHGCSALNHYSEDYEECLLDGFFVFHNPYAKNPLSREAFNRREIAQVYEESGDIVAAIPKGYLLERSCIHLVPK